MTSGAVALVERRVIRRRGIAQWLLVVVIGLSAGSVMALVAGGRRAATSYDRLIAWSDPFEAELVGPSASSSEEADKAFAAIGDWPMVESAHRTLLMGDGVAVNGETLPFATLLPVTVEAGGPPGRKKFVAGRQADPSAVG